MFGVIGAFVLIFSLFNVFSNSPSIFGVLGVIIGFVSFFIPSIKDSVSWGNSSSSSSCPYMGGDGGGDCGGGGGDCG